MTTLENIISLKNSIKRNMRRFESLKHGDDLATATAIKYAAISLVEEVRTLQAVNTSLSR